MNAIFNIIGIPLGYVLWFIYRFVDSQDFRPYRIPVRRFPVYGKKGEYYGTQNGTRRQYKKNPRPS